MDSIIKLITGIVLILAGIGLCVTSFMVTFWFLIYGIPWIIIGIIILFNKKENEIEPRKDLNKQETKK